MLTAREQLIVRLREGLDGEEKHTFQQIGDSLALSRERISQLYRRAQRKLRDAAYFQRQEP